MRRTSDGVKPAGAKTWKATGRNEVRLAMLLDSDLEKGMR